MSTLAHLFAPLRLRDVELPNRIMSTGHQTYLARGGLPTPDFVAYHEARARGGAGLIVTEAARFHASTLTETPEIVILGDEAIPAFRKVVDAVHAHGTRIFGQLSHSGRLSRRVQGGLRGVAYAPSSVPDNRFHTMPREMPEAMIREIVEAYGHAARRLAAAGYDGVEVIASLGLLVAQFLNPASNRRTDRYGGSRENRMRFLVEALEQVRRAIGEGRALGIRISAEEVEADGLPQDEVLEVCRSLAARGLVDYANVTIGSMAGLGGSIHVVPPMEVAHGYVAPKAAAIRAATGLPVFVAGRINQPQLAERIIASGQADVCGMTRALISDPEMPAKARAGRLDEIRACIGCNQGCIGHFHQGYPVSCIQNPLTGRELRLGPATPAPRRRRVLVAGGGPAGMKAAVAAAERGHEAILCEAGPRLGGQVLLAQRLPERAEFGGLVTNLEGEIARAGVEVRLRTRVDAALVRALAPDAVVLATGGVPFEPEIEGREDGHVVDAWSVLRAEANPGARVLVADWRCDWIGMGVAEMLARNGHQVRLAVNGTHAGQHLQMYHRDHLAGKLHRLGVEVIPYARLHGVDADSALLMHVVTGEGIACEGVDTVVLAAGQAPAAALERELEGLGVELHLAGDCLSPRSAEEAVYEGMLAGRAV